MVDSPADLTGAIENDRMLLYFRLVEVLCFTLILESISRLLCRVLRIQSIAGQRKGASFASFEVTSI
jgi:hypothetical protein